MEVPEENNIIQYYEIFDPSHLVDTTDSLSFDLVNPNENDQEQVLYYIQNDDNTLEESNIILTENELDLSIDNESEEQDAETFKVITMQDGQICITETSNLDDIEITTQGNESLTNSQEGFLEIELDGSRAFIAESVWQLFSKKDDSNLANALKLKKKRADSRRFPCRVEGCSKFYTSTGNLMVHMRAHTGSKPFACPLASCGKVFVTGYSLKTHIRSHSGEKPYPCMVCSKSFKTSGDLSKHLRTHTGERPFPCTITGCNKRFTTSNIRKVHERSHTGERPYMCDFENCGKSFASATNHKNHVRIHTGEKPYVCKIQNCPKRFTEYSSLYKHSMVHLQGDIYRCDICLQPTKSEATLRQHKRSAHCFVELDGGLELYAALPMMSAEDNCQEMADISPILMSSVKEQI